MAEVLGRSGRWRHGRAVPCLGQRSGALLQQCLQEGRLFQDRSFPAGPTALGCRELGPRSHKTQGVVWCTPTELCPNPQFIASGATRTDICQGALEGWLLAAIAFLTLNEEILAHVVPKDQSFQDKYTGIFHFQFWQCGEWMDVVVDDRLPTKNGELLLVPLAEGSEFWSALLEKAHAKLNGSYESLSGGTTTKGFKDFTSGTAGWYELHKPPPNLFRIIQKALQKGSLLGCSTAFKGQTAQAVAVKIEGDVPSDHSAAGTGAVTFQKLVEGHADSPGQRMVFSDFLRHYSCLDICSLTPGTLASDRYKKWSLQKLDGNWRRGATAGGCRNYPNTFWMNPQYLIKLEEEDEDHNDPEGGCAFPIGLIQEHCRKQKRMGEDMHTIGFAIYEVPPEGDDEIEGNFDEIEMSEDDIKPSFKKLFGQLAGNMTGFLDEEISAFELHSIMNKILAKRQDIKSDCFSIETCKIMVDLLDNDGSGRLGLKEFQPLWTKTQKYQKIYREIDVDRLGTMNSHEMRRALETAGLKLNCQLHQITVARFADEDLVIDFDNFACCLIRLKTLFMAVFYCHLSHWHQPETSTRARSGEDNQATYK